MNVRHVPGVSVHVSMEGATTPMGHTTVHVSLAMKDDVVKSTTMTVIPTSVKMVENAGMVLDSSVVFANRVLMEDTAKMTLMNVHQIHVRMVLSAANM